MISNGYKSLFATVLMAITLARSAPLQDMNASGEPRLIEGVQERQLKDSPLELGNHSMVIKSPTMSKEHHHHHSHHHQAQVVPDGEDFAAELSDDIPSNGEELAEHVINLRDYIETLSEDEFEGFLEHYMDNASKDDMFALELALDLDADDRDEEDDFDYYASPDPWDAEDDEGAIRFVPYSEVHGGKHRHHRERLHNHRRQHRFEEEVGCDEEDIAMGLCEPSVELEEHPRHHQRHHHHHGRHQELDDELMCTDAEIEQGLCGEVEEHSRHHRHHGQHHSHSHLRHGKEILEPSSHHHRDHQMLTKADGFPFGDTLTRSHHKQHHNDADLLGMPEEIHLNHKPFGISIIEQASAVPIVTAANPEGAGPAHPVKIAEVHVQEVPSVGPRAVDDESTEEQLTKRDPDPKKKKHHHNKKAAEQQPADMPMDMGMPTE